MKKIIITLCVIAAAALAAGSLYAVAGNLVDKVSENNAFTGSGDIVTRTFELDAFSAVRARHSAHVTVVEGSGPVTVRVDDNMAPYVIVRVEKGRLVVGFDDQVRSTRNVTFEVTVPCDGKLTELKASGASKIIVEPILSNDRIELDASGASKIVAMVECLKCEIDASGASKIEAGGVADVCEADASGASKISLAVRSKQCELDASGASKIAAQGNADRCDLDASGASSIDAEALKTLDAAAESSGSSSVRLYCTRSLRASASGAGKIAYRCDGPVSLSTNSSGAGRIKQL